MLKIFNTLESAKRYLKDNKYRYLEISDSKYKIVASVLILQVHKDKAKNALIIINKNTWN